MTQFKLVPANENSRRTGAKPVELKSSSPIIGGLQQREISNSEAFEIVEARKLVSGEAAARAAQFMTDIELNELNACLSEIYNAFSSGVDGADLERDFHLMTAKASNNAGLELAVKMLWDFDTFHFVRSLYEPASQMEVELFISELRAIVTAIGFGDSRAARNAVHSHHVSSLSRILRQSRGQPHTVRSADEKRRRSGPLHSAVL